jgi:hypothetical protein
VSFDTPEAGGTGQGFAHPGPVDAGTALPSFPGGSGQDGRFPPQWVPVQPPKRSRARLIRPVAALLLVGAVGFHYVTGHHGASSAVSAVVCDPQQLTSCLVAAPRGSSPLQGAWALSTTPSTAMYLDEFYDSGSAIGRQTTEQNLASAQLQTIAHVAWQAADGNGVDITLLRFATPQGAASRALTLTGGFVADSSFVGTPAPDGASGDTWSPAAALRDGSYETDYATSVGDVAMEVHYFALSRGAISDFDIWVGAEYTGLKKAPPPKTQPVPASGETTDCGASLGSCLIAAPAGATRWPTSWGAETRASVSEFAREYYSGSDIPLEEARLKAQGVTAIAHETWSTVSGGGADLVLLQFGSALGAQSRYDWASTGEGGTKFTLPGRYTAVGYHTAKTDSEGMIDTDVYGLAGSVAVELHAFNPGSFDQASVDSSIAHQLDRLDSDLSPTTVTTPPLTVTAAGVPDTGTGGACDSPADCLIKAPSGAGVWDDDAYDKATTVTVAQYTGNGWSGESAAEQQYEATLLTDAGETGIAHRAWTAGDADEADMTLIQFGDRQDAQAEALDYQGAMTTGGRMFAVPGRPGFVGDADGMDAEGEVHVQITGAVGDYDVRMDYWSPATFSQADAITWFDEQLNALPDSA